jgi:hypothetical protein
MKWFMSSNISGSLPIGNRPCALWTNSNLQVLRVMTYKPSGIADRFSEEEPLAIALKIIVIGNSTNRNTMHS